MLPFSFSADENPLKLLYFFGEGGVWHESPCPKHVFIFRNNISFYGEEFSAPCPTHKRKDHPLSAVRECFFSVYFVFQFAIQKFKD